MDFVKNKAPCAAICAPDSGVAQFAAMELQSYIAKMTGCYIPIGEAGGNIVQLQIGVEELRHDGFRICCEQNRVTISANQERGLLFGVYALLERFGCRWFLPGKEYVPTKADLWLEEMDIFESPDFETRLLMEESGYDWLRNGGDPAVWLEETLEMLDWAAKNRLNTFDIFLHNMILEEIPHLNKIAEELQKRGMLFATGGHCVRAFVDQALFESKPYLFVEKNGARIPEGNLCCASEEVHTLLLARFKEVLRRLPDLSILHTWFADVFGGDWCECAHCRKLTPAQQQFRIVNRLAAGLAEEFPQLKIDMLLYHDTLELTELPEPPASNLLGLYAARERCYAHVVNDFACARNADNFENLKKVATKFDALVFEYYTDLILFTKMAVAMPKRIASDLQSYRSLGISKVSCLSFLRYTRWAYPVNLYTYARAAWDTEFDFSTVCGEYCATLYPAHAQLMEQVLTTLEKASSLLLTVCEYKGDFNDLRLIPNQPEMFHTAHIRQIKEAIELLEACLLRMEDEALENEKDILLLTTLELQSIWHHLNGDYDAAIEKKRRILTLIGHVPQGCKGVSGFQPFVDHLCNEQIDWLNNQKSKSKFSKENQSIQGEE